MTRAAHAVSGLRFAYANRMRFAALLFLLTTTVGCTTSTYDQLRNGAARSWVPRSSAPTTQPIEVLELPVGSVPNPRDFYSGKFDREWLVDSMVSEPYSRADLERYAKERSADRAIVFVSVKQNLPAFAFPGQPTTVVRFDRRRTRTEMIREASFTLKPGEGKASVAARLGGRPPDFIETPHSNPALAKTLGAAETWIFFSDTTYMTATLHWCVAFDTGGKVVKSTFVSFLSTYTNGGPDQFETIAPAEYWKTVDSIE